MSMLELRSILDVVRRSASASGRVPERRPAAPNWVLPESVRLVGPPTRCRMYDAARPLCGYDVSVQVTPSQFPP